MNDVRAITICVDYHDYLAVTLHHNIRQFKSMLVVTTRHDERTIEVAHHNGAQVLCTDVFYERNAVFNKFAAIEQGLDYIGRKGWLCLIDADIAMSTRHETWQKRIGKFYVPRRRIMDLPPEFVPEERIWRQHHWLKGDTQNHCQIFHADDPVLGKPPWHQTDWTWAGGENSLLVDGWVEQEKVRPPFDVLHLGPVGVNWAGRTSRYADGSYDSRAPERRGRFENLINLRRADIMQNKNRRCDDRYAAEKLT